jgi:hypothetical protein
MIRIRLLAFLLAPLGSLSISCGFSVIAHDEQAAAKSAAKFADLAFARSDYPGAHALLSPQLQQATADGKLAAEVAKMHPKGRPSEVKAIEFEPLPGQRAMNIYLKGTRSDEEFFYRLLMVGDKAAGYKVGGLWRGNGPYPPSARKPL